MTYSVRWSVQANIENKYVLLPEVPYRTSRLEFSESKDSLFCYGLWTLNLGSNYLDKSYFSIGTELLFSITTESYGTKTIAMSILSMSLSLSTGGQSLPDVYTIEMVSPWYFNQQVNSVAYRGNGSSIIQQVLQEFPSSLLSKPISVSTSIDTANTRYRTFQTQDAFLRSRVLPYTQGVLNSSFFIMGSLGSTIEALSYEDIRLKGKSVLISRAHPDFRNIGSKVYSTLEVPEAIVLVNLSVNINTSENHNLWHLANSKLIALDPFSPSLLQGVSDSVLPPLGRDHARRRFSPIKNSASSTEVGYPIFDESLQSPSDILSRALHKQSFLLRKEHIFTAIVEPNLNIQSARLASVKLITNEGAPSIYSQDFLISGVSHVIDSNSQIVSTLYLDTTSFSYTNEEDVRNIVHLEK